MIDWTFQSSKSSRAWAEVLRDMIPCGIRTWTSLPGWDTRWSVSLASNPKQGEFRVTLLVWPQPSQDVAW